MNKAISRKDAKAAGLIHYFTGKTCPHGHVDKRFVSTYACVTCTDEHKKRYRLDPDFKKKELAYKSSYRDVNREKNNAYAKAYWRENPNAKEVSRRTKSKNAASISKYNAKYWQENKDKLSRRFKVYSRNNLSYFRAANAKRRSLLSAGGTHTADDVSKIINMQNNLCVYCGDDISDDYHVDHIMPLALGGSNWPSNLQCLCPTCNLRKSAKHPDVWERELEGKQ